MSWELEIHHIDVGAAGDATLIIARNGADVRSALIDGGPASSAAYVHGYIQARLTKLDAIAVTHYDKDHLDGIVSLLTRKSDIYSEVRVYDRGWPEGRLDDRFIAYLNAINGRSRVGNQVVTGASRRSRVTKAVKSGEKAPGVISALCSETESSAMPAGKDAKTLALAIKDSPHWLLEADDRREILKAPNGPTLTCIACNQYVRVPGQPVKEARSTDAKDSENPRSLAFLLEFGKFRYCLGGDIEDKQEQLISEITKPDQADDRILVVKASHHGSKSSTSEDFIRRLRPEAVVISSGQGQEELPAPATASVLSGLTRKDTPRLPPPPGTPGRAVDTYLTGIGDVDTPEAVIPVHAVVAGDPERRRPGDIVITVSERQADSAAFPGRLHRGIRVAAEAAARAAGNANPASLAKAAADAALTTNPVAAACSFLGANPPGKEMAEALWAVSCAKSEGIGQGVGSELIVGVRAARQDLKFLADTVVKPLADALDGQTNVLTIRQTALDIANAANAIRNRFIAALDHARKLRQQLEALSVQHKRIELTARELGHRSPAQAVVERHLDVAKAADLDKGAKAVRDKAAETGRTAGTIHAGMSKDEARKTAKKVADLAVDTCDAALENVTLGETVADAYLATAAGALDISPFLAAAVITLKAGTKDARAAGAGAAIGAAIGGGDSTAVARAVAGALRGIGRMDPGDVPEQAAKNAAADLPALFVIEYFDRSENRFSVVEHV